MSAHYVRFCKPQMCLDGGVSVSLESSDKPAYFGIRYFQAEEGGVSSCAWCERVIFVFMCLNVTRPEAQRGHNINLLWRLKKKNVIPGLQKHTVLIFILLFGSQIHKHARAHTYTHTGTEKWMCWLFLAHVWADWFDCGATGLTSAAIFTFR